MASNATPVTSGPVVTTAASVSGVAANNSGVVGFDVKKMARKDREFLGEFDAQVKGKAGQNAPFSHTALCSNAIGPQPPT